MPVNILIILDLTPVIKNYIDSFCSGFKNKLKDVKVSFMQSDGGLVEAKFFSGFKGLSFLLLLAILSGPAG
jgi:5-oxoprolinase (ATP-hydrolysing)